TNVSQLTEVITIDKNIVIEGLDSNSRPTLSIDFSQPTSGLAILPAKTLTLRNIDIQAINHTTQSLLTNTGTLSVEGLVEIKD
ncbi:MAG: hypothetical protein KA161_05645, partial [Saprospiraceae bacterium]|nr:hypothetical protein [Saprospiraceae bacterium]